VLSQAVAPQVVSLVLQAVMQQLPVPLTPQTPEVQPSSVVHDPVTRFGKQELVGVSQ
jgi:hypothetical protein